MKQYRNKEWLYGKYITERLLPREIAEICSCHVTVIPEWLRKFKIPVRNISQAKTGRPLSERQKKFLPRLWQSHYKPGEYKHSDEAREKIRQSKLGEKNPQWKDGAVKYYREWRKSVFKRDWYTCQRCLIRSGCGKTVYFNAHHIIPVTVAPEEKLEISNGTTLCEPCHYFIHSNELAVNQYE